MNYIIQTIAFQLLFLVIYDFFLKKETFFNWNRAYLLATPLLSLTLPFIELESLKTTMPENYVFLLPEVTVTANEVSETTVRNTLLPDWSVWQWLLFAGSALSMLWFAYKIFQLYRMKQSGNIHYFKEYTRVEVAKENTAFSFFKNIYIGSGLLQKNHKHIIQHELVHIKERHSWDLMLFELLRIIFWFNPLIYIYQNRITELHEFIADAKTVKDHKKEHYQFLLQEAFQTEHISFINQFFNHSLIKKRIVMLQKSKSKKVWQLKYLLLIPMVLGMLLYTSCEREETVATQQETISLEEQVKQLEAALEGKELTPELRKQLFSLAVKASRSDITTSGEFDESKYKGEDVPFTVIPFKPRFAACDVLPESQQFDCFKQELDKHVIRTFTYPEEAQKRGAEGRVYVNFRINTDGTVTILGSRAPDPALDAEGRRIIEALPTFIPGKDANGKPLPVSFAYPIVFKLS